MTLASPISRRYAVCVGINEYHPQTGLGSLRFAERDAQAVHQILLSPGLGFASEDTCLLTGAEATLDAINTALGSYIINRPNANDLVFFYFAGHSEPLLLREEWRPLEVFLAPYDFDPEKSRNDRYFRRQHTLSMSRLRQMFFEHEDGAGKRLFILDSCYSGAFVNSNEDELTGNSVQAYIGDKLDTTRLGRVALSSCLPGQRAKEDPALGHGVMTYHMLCALRGEAPAAQDWDGYVTIPLLFNYLMRNLPAEQCPVLSGIQQDTFDLVWYPPPATTAQHEDDAAPFVVEHDWSPGIGDTRKSTRLPPAQNLPVDITLQDLLVRNTPDFDPRSWAALCAMVQHHWKASRDPVQVCWPKAAIGVGTNERMCTIQLNADASQGSAHLAVAGGVGSGKSEFLLSLALSLALQYDPHVLQFVLVDYKDGGMLRQVEGLPHCVDVVTGLDTGAIQRLFVLLRVELDRRQQRLATTGCHDIIAYHKKGFHQNDPMPHLMIIVSEGTDLLHDLPSLSNELDTIIRAGRRPGFHLLLGTRLPSSLVGQVLEGIRLRVNLRRDGVAPGRGYIKFSNNSYEHIQVAYSGKPFKTTSAEGTQSWSRFSDAIVAVTRSLNAGEPLHASWTPPLPELVSLLDEVPCSYPDEAGHTPQPIVPALRQWLNDAGHWSPVVWGETALRVAVGLIDDVATGRWLPLEIDLTHGHTIIYGATKWGKTSFLRSLAVSLTATHSPRELHLHLFDLEGRSLEMLDALPHVGTYITINKRDYTQRVHHLLRELEALLNTRQLLLQEACTATLMDYNTAHPDTPLPTIVVLIDNIDELIHTFTDSQGRLEDSDDALEAFALLTRQGTPCGLHFVASCSRPDALVSKLYGQFTQRLTLNLADSSDYSKVLGKMVNPPGEIPGRGYFRNKNSLLLSYQIALFTRVAQPELRLRDETTRIRDLGVRMVSALPPDEQGGHQPVRIEALPTQVLYRDVFSRWFKLGLDGQTWLAALTAASRQSWHQHATAEQADWLKVPLGRGVGGRDRVLHFAARFDGVHALIAGTTDSGKSELLTTLIIGLALIYGPDTLNLVLVDYKGGGAFSEFRTLPHCVNIITNPDGDSVNRMFTVIQSALKRRQALNAETGTKNIVDYRKKGLHQTHHPYPYLFIIIDEFAEMIANHADYKAQLENITRVGHAQGVSLILTAQRPSGITDQMRSNIKLRICLQVETPGESREMLRRSDAAFLPTDTPGRGYMQVGNDAIELIQVAYTSEQYSDDGQASKAKVIWTDRHDGDVTFQEQEPRELYKVLIDLLATMAQQLGIKKQHAPWPDFLPTQLALSELLVAADPEISAVTSEEYLVGTDHILLGRARETELTLNPAVNQWLTGNVGWIDPLDWKIYAVRPVVGLIDNPYAAQQLPLIVDLSRGHAVVFGASGWGKTTFIRTLIVSLAATHSPNHLHMYILDLGGRNLGVLAKLPHVGALIIPDAEGYEERVEQLLRVLEDLIEKRKTILSNAGLPDIYQYNQAHPDAVQPAVIMAIDNFVEFVETFGNQDDDVESVLDKFVTLARQSRAYGIHFVISVNHLGNLSNQVYSLFTERFTLKLTDPSEYRAIVGGTVPDINDIPGRGYTKIGRQPLSFQVAVPLDLQRGDGATANEVKELDQLAFYMQEHIARSGRIYNKPTRVDALPKAVLLKQLLAREHRLELNQTFLDRLETITRQQWARSIEPAQADWLKVTIGVVSGNRPRPLHLEAKQDGVHGMIAGGTGSGKSELLMTLIVGLALNYSPTILNFVLVDYKGGGAFEPFKRLPHCVDMITNLNRVGVQRMFTAINAEMQRRQKLNAQNDVKDIVEYRAKGLHKKVSYPHLLIIIDEYAEMITDNPEFRNELDRITGLGRSLGVSLLLAAQRPTEVSDQMRANIKFRVCLRVEGINTSREMLRRSDAAFLPSGMPGRGFLQVGNENIELMQVAYTGEKYEYAATPEGGEKPSFYEVIVQLAKKLSGEARPRTPWPPALPTALTMSYPLIAEYLAPDARTLVTLGHSKRLALNPFAQAWLEGSGTWYGLDWNTTAMRAVVGLLDNPYHAQQGPLVVDFTRGHAVLFGASGWGKTTFMRSLVVSLACTHSPDEFQAHVLDLGGHSLEVLGALPHVGTIITPDERGYEERVQELWRELNDLVDMRKKLFTKAGVSTFYEYNRVPDRQREPAILVVLDNMTEFIETFGEMGQKARKGDGDSLLEAFVLLARQGKAYGLHFAISASRLNALSSKLYSLFTERYTLRLSEASDYSAIVGSQVSEIEEITGRGYTRSGRLPLAFQVALPPNTVDDQGQVSGEIAQIRMLGERMQTYIKQAAHPYRQPLYIAALPKSSSYRQVLREVFQLSQQEQTFLDELKVAVQQTWERHASAEHADWLEVTLGITSGNRLRPLYLEAKKDGVHGMIAGGTGSGKSELLMTLIVGLALNYTPDILNFVLVDYKGGGAFKPFERLPHCVDIVTNLNKSAVDRMFTAINAEIRRRQALNAETGTKDIVEYRLKGWHKTHQAYPHLFIIIDEYAEMIDANPEYRAELESITRVGRAQGINLILASQRPKGVSDQMRANIKLRLCLRVEQTDTSQELLRRPDAAFLPNSMPGRGYLQVGNETIELIQVSYTGEAQPDNRAPLVTWPERVQGTNQAGNVEIPRLYDMAVTLVSELTSGQQVAKPWPSFLPDTFSLQMPLLDAKNNQTFILEPAVTDWLNNDIEGLWAGVDWQKDALYPVVGLVDDPAEAAQDPLRVNLRTNHLAIFGDAGLGKTTLLRTLLISLMATHSPAEFQAYVLDLGGRNLRSMEAFPHVGAVVHANDEHFDERLQRLMEKLSRMTEQRQQMISEADVSTIYEFNARYPDQLLPPIVVVIDNYVELQENYDDLIANVLLPMLRRSLSVGIVFVITCNVPNNIASKVYNMFGERLTFKQTNFDRYIDIVGRGAVEIDDLPGRGYIRRTRRPLLFHAAQAVGLFQPDEPDRRDAADELRLMTEAMHACLEKRKLRYTRLDPIDILPGRIALDSVIQHAVPVSPQRIEAVIGQTGSLETALFDLNQSGPHFVIAGPPRSGKTTTLYNWVLSLAERYPPERVKFVLVDMQRKFFEYGGKQRLSELPHVLTTVAEVEQMLVLVTHLQTEVTVLANQPNATYKLFVVIDNYDEFNEETDKDRNLIRDLATLARRYGRDGLHFIISGVLDGSKSDFQRRIQAANSGIGLQTAQALDTFRVARMPAALRRGELPLGRGYMVQSGQPTLIQVAVPWASSGFVATTGDFENETEQLIQTLDTWVQKLCARYPDQRACWASGTVEPEPTQMTTPQQSAKTRRMIEVLQAGMRKELARLQDGNGAEELLTTALVQQMNASGWQDEAILKPLLKGLWIKEQVATGIYSREEAEDMFNTWDIDSVLDMLEHFLSSGSAT